MTVFIVSEQFIFQSTLARAEAVWDLDEYGVVKVRPRNMYEHFNSDT